MAILKVIESVYWYKILLYKEDILKIVKNKDTIVKVFYNFKVLIEIYTSYILPNAIWEQETAQFIWR